MRFRRVAFAVFAAVMAAGSITAAAPAAAPSAAPSIALSRLETGRYELKLVGSTDAPRLLCLADTAMLVQLQHPGVPCSRLMVADGPDSTTINYSCMSGGHGRTVVTITTPRSFDLQTQGISSGAPFDLDYQGRRVGACGTRATASR
jgi:hypothetical protein